MRPERKQYDRLAAIDALDIDLEKGKRVPQSAPDPVHRAQVVASTDPAEADADWETWSLVMGETARIIGGVEPSAAEKTANPDLYAICFLMAGYVRKRREKYVDGTV